MFGWNPSEKIYPVHLDGFCSTPTVKPRVKVAIFCTCFGVRLVRGELLFKFNIFSFVLFFLWRKI